MFCLYADAQKAAKKRARATTAAASRAKRESKQVSAAAFCPPCCFLPALLLSCTLYCPHVLPYKCPHPIFQEYERSARHLYCCWPVIVPPACTAILQVPNLIFQVEEYERHLIRISKTSERVWIPFRNCLRAAWERCLNSIPRSAGVSSAHFGVEFVWGGAWATAGHQPLHLPDALPTLPTPTLFNAGKVNLMGTARRATNRDFKIRLDKYNEGAQAGGGGKRRRQQAAEEEDGQAEEGEEEEAGAMEGEGEELVQEEEEEEEA